MRHLGGIAVGCCGTFVGIVVIAAGLGLTRRAVEQLTRGPLLLGTALLLIGGAAIGAVAIFRRMSVAAPLTGAAVTLLLTVLGLAAMGIAGPRAVPPAAPPAPTGPPYPQQQQPWGVPGPPPAPR